MLYHVGLQVLGGVKAEIAAISASDAGRILPTGSGKALVVRWPATDHNAYRRVVSGLDLWYRQASGGSEGDGTVHRRSGDKRQDTANG